MKTLYTKHLPRILILLSISLVLSGTIAYYCHHIISHPSTHTIINAPAIIKGNKITLKELTEADFIDYHNMLSNTVRKGLEFPDVISLGFTVRLLQNELQRCRSNELLMYGIFDNVNSKLIGAIQIREKNDYDPGQVSYWLNETYWSSGRAQEALKLIIKAYFDVHPEAQYITAHSRLWNKRSYGLLLKCGFKDVGYFYEDGKASRYVLEYSHK